MKRPPHTSFFTGIALSVLAALAVAGCPTGADLDDPERFTTGDLGYCDAKPIFEKSCGLSSTCHAPNEADPSKPILGYIDLISPGVERRLIDQPANYDTVDFNKAQCPVSDPELLVDSADSNESLMIKKIEDRQDCGRKMPYTGADLSETSIQCIRDWIDGIIVDFPAAGGAGQGGGAQ